MLSYLMFGWIGGLIMYFTQKHPEVRFHAAQSILLFGPLHAISILLGVFGGGLFGFGGATSFGVLILLSGLLNLFSFIMWIVMSIQGYGLKHMKLPIIGDMAEQWAAKPA
ncbi:MAG: DUF4870 domain-containing protein [Euzebya sp.]